LDYPTQKTPEGQLVAGMTLSNRYLIQQSIGSGGMGAVYRARDLHFPSVTKLVAVKEMVHRARDPKLRETVLRNFEREANLLATLSHPAIPRIYDYFSQGERSYLILEYVQGKDLERILSATSEYLQQEQVLRWGVELCDVLQYLHTNSPEPIIFRDLKPSNVMVNEHNHIILVDFGIARTMQAGARGTMIGTEGYSPPEQYRGDATPRVDIYALGATLHHLLTRRDPRLEPPFSFGERPICQINPQVSPQLETVVIKALQYEAENRFQSAIEMKDALLAAQTVFAGQSRPESSATPPAIHSGDMQPAWTFTCEDEIRGTARIDRGTVYFGSYDRCLYALSLESGRLLWKYQSDGGIVSRPAVFSDLICFGSEDYRLHVAATRSGSISWTYYTKGPVRSSPEISHGHIFVGSDDGYLHAVNLSTGRGTWQTDVTFPIRSSPLVESDSIYFGNEEGEFYCLDFRGSPRWRYKARRAITSSPAYWDNLVFFSSLDANLYALDARSGHVTWRFRFDKGSISTPCVSDSLVFAGSADGNLYAVDTETGREVWRFKTGHQVSGSPLVHRDALYCGSIDGSLYCLESRTGKLVWRYETGGPITATPIIQDGILYFGSTDHQFYALPV
jgi:eukaryotic-like serine/threonine-protein kinase